MLFRNLMLLVVLPLSQMAHAGQIDFAGMLVDFNHGLLDNPESLGLPLPYSASFEWNESTRESHFEFTVPGITTDDFTIRPINEPSGPFVFRSRNLYSDLAEVVETASSFEANFNSFVGPIITGFDMDLDLSNGTGEWSVGQNCPVCFFVGFHGARGTVTSLTSVVPEPTNGLLLVSSCLIVITCRKKM